MSIVDFTPETKGNELAEQYAPAIQELIAAGEGKGYELNVPTAEKGKHSLGFQKAANAVDKTARVRLSEDDEEAGTTRLVFTLTKRHSARRSAGDTEEAESAPEVSAK